MEFPLSSPRRFAPVGAARRHLVTVASVVLLHLAALWALQTGLLQRVVEVLVPVQVLSELIEPPRPRIEPPSPVSKSVPQAVPRKAESAPPPPMPSPAQVELPSSDADYLQNPKPAYPAMSKRLGEQGKVMVRVLIGVDGRAQKAEIRQSSGYERLDQAALSTAQRWRYMPGKRDGLPEAMWFSVPINFILE